MKTTVYSQEIFPKNPLPSFSLGVAQALRLCLPPVENDLVPSDFAIELTHYYIAATLQTTTLNQKQTVV